MNDRNPGNLERKYCIVKYGSGSWDGKWVVRRTTVEDIAATLDRPAALKLAETLRRADVFELGEGAVGKEIG